MATKQIELDLMRTFPTHRDYSDPDSEHIQRLRRVLVAYSWHHDNVGCVSFLPLTAQPLRLDLEPSLSHVLEGPAPRCAASPAPFFFFSCPVPCCHACQFTPCSTAATARA